jgi:hypothetical protein
MEYIEYSLFVQNLKDGSSNWSLTKRLTDFTNLVEKLEAEYGLSIAPLNIPITSMKVDWEIK